jgi:'Cold-shock' DNA-binding domain
MTGTIRPLRADKGFGFIKDEAGKEYFFHQSAVYGEGLDNLRTIARPLATTPESSAGIRRRPRSRFDSGPAHQLHLVCS